MIFLITKISRTIVNDKTTDMNMCIFQINKIVPNLHIVHTYLTDVKCRCYTLGNYYIRTNAYVQVYVHIYLCSLLLFVSFTCI